ncbi:MAG: hypothetical protein Q8L90_05830 [Bacteroidota bacterium]|nr:hypothetical protein [Bacteroidota bacterium]
MAIYIAKFGIYKKSNRCVGRQRLAPLGKIHLLKLADYFKIKKANEIIQQVEEVVSNWKVYAKEAGV